ncbi:hypothetical protein CS006_03015 [Bifidobacterium primatium]|uniref:GmrSD restriction endonucleases N-terminal domain-containing protein n=1 Tax=Bifidobacterium primatium TaxID=2045438 RepID=A0A2M9HBD2_9BIFI|nr:DUF262 domain-containing protein [Bifidobacterium primatium]PJM74125.1 hypothetical protein CS006_03015 [Bifidobacterium primatium]
MPDYRIDKLSVDELDRIKLPKFQRGFVWTKKKQDDFVQTLHDGYPFGTLLVYPENDNDKNASLQLLDGQQRLSTIRNYQREPLRFWKPLNRDEYMQAFTTVNGMLTDEEKLTESEFDHIVNQPETDIALWAINVSKIDDSKNSTTSIIETIHNFKERIDEFVDIKHLQVPMIVYLGGAEHIADVFANLNKGGIPLTKYEVFGAAWVNATIRLLPAEESPLQDQILQYVKNYYLDMQKQAEFDLNKFSEDDLTQDRTITLPELGTALGQYVVSHLNALIPYTDSAAQEIGFGLLGVAMKLDNRKLNILNTYKQKIADSLEDILQKTERICNNLQDMFAILLRRFKSTGNDYENGLSSTFKTLSYFAALWDLEPSSEEYQHTLRNIKAAYVYDAITSAWSSHGDQRLLSYCDGSRNYSAPISKNQFKSAFDQWIKDQTAGINFGKDIRCLVTIHANLSYMSASVPNGETFELEHIIARKRINDADNPKKRSILGNSLGNCMYLPKGINNPKKDRTLYEVNDHNRYSQLIKDSEYFSEETMNQIMQALSNRDYTTINNLLQERSAKVAYTLVDALLNGSIRL